MRLLGRGLLSLIGRKSGECLPESVSRPKPTLVERCANCAMRLLNGERILEPSVVFQANFRQGGGVQTAYYDKSLGWTYFCYSTKMYLYTA